MRIFLAGASGAIGRRLVPLLLRAGHKLTGTTRSAAAAKELERAGANAAVLDVFDAATLSAAMRAAAPEVVIHQLTDLPREFDPARIAGSYANNARIRVEGTRNLIAAAGAVAARRLSCRASPSTTPPVASHIPRPIRSISPTRPGPRP
jgi:nucleoside-diphosphate-sugar epimerase